MQKPIEICIGVGLNQFFPEYITLDFSDESEDQFDEEKWQEGLSVLHDSSCQPKVDSENE